MEEREKAALRQVELARAHKTLGSNDPKVETGTATQFAAKKIGVSEPTFKRCVKLIERLRTGIAALNLKRQFIGIEIDEDSFRKAEARIRVAVSQTSEKEVST